MKIGLQHKNEKIENSRIQPKYEKKLKFSEFNPNMKISKIPRIQPKYEKFECSQNLSGYEKFSGLNLNMDF